LFSKSTPTLVISYIPLLEIQPYADGTSLRWRYNPLLVVSMPLTLTQEKPVPWKVQPLSPKQKAHMVRAQPKKNHSHSRHRHVLLTTRIVLLEQWFLTRQRGVNKPPVGCEFLNTPYNMESLIKPFICYFWF